MIEELRNGLACSGGDASALSRFADEELSLAEMESLRAHLVGCEECAAVLHSIVRVKSRLLASSPPLAAGLGSQWSEIEGRLSNVRRRRLTGAERKLILIAASAVVAVGIASFAALRTSPTAPMQAHIDPYARSVAELEGRLAAQRPLLEESTRASLDESLAIIDTAISETRRALGRESTNAFLTQYLIDLQRQKVQALREAYSPMVPGA